MHLNDKPLAHCVNDRRAHAVQTAGNLVAPAAELAACVQNCENDLKCALAGLLLNVNGNAAAVILDGNDIAGLNDDLYAVAVACQRLVDGVIDNFVDKVVQTRGGGRADIHTRALADRFQSLKHLNLRRVVFLCYLICDFRHISKPAFKIVLSYIGNI